MIVTLTKNQTAVHCYTTNVIASSTLNTILAIHCTQVTHYPLQRMRLYRWAVLNPPICNQFPSHLLRNCPVWWLGLKNSPTVTGACRKRRIKWVPSAWGYNWVTLSPGVINTEAWSSRLGVGLTIQPRKNVIVTKPHEGRPGPEFGWLGWWWWWRN
jgi:hypothetical protein